MRYSIGSYTVFYNRSEKIWLVDTGDQEITFDPAEDEEGRNGKQRAFIFALRAQFPAVAEAVQTLIDRHQDHPGLPARAWRAAMLVVAGHVIKPRRREAGPYAEGPWRLVQSQRDAGQVYSVSFRHGMRCTCPDNQEGAPVLAGLHQMCKHAIAALVADRLDMAEEAKPDRALVERGINRPTGRRHLINAVGRGRTSEEAAIARAQAHGID